MSAQSARSAKGKYTMAGKKRSGLRAADEMAPGEEGAEPSGRTTAAQAAESCRACADQCTACADACEGGTADEAIDAANMTIETLDATKGTLMAFLGKSEEEAAPPAEAPAPEEQQAAAAILHLSGKASLASSLPIVKAWQRAAAEQAKFEERRAAAEAVERRELVAELVKLGLETPATAWAPSAAGVPDGITPVKRLQSEPIDDLRARVDVMRAARGQAWAPKPPAATAAGSLSALEIEKCKARGVDPEAYASQRAALRGRGSNQP
jgi:hypothetical protein